MHKIHLGSGVCIEVATKSSSHATLAGVTRDLPKLI